MPCYSPLRAWRGKPRADGKMAIVWRVGQAVRRDACIDLPCGQCIGCRLERSRQWAMRCVHEASLYDENCFVTLTYSPEHLPKDGTLNVRDFQLFMKRLRKAYPRERIRFFHCGEYGEELARPHYHALLFNFNFKDREPFKENNGVRWDVSNELTSIWGKGHCLVGDVTFDSAAYVARYVVKKVNGEKAETHYEGKIPEYITMSRRPGIGRDWYDKYRDDVYPMDGVVIRGIKMRPPKFYDAIYKEENRVMYDKIKERRRRCGVTYSDDRRSDGKLVRVSNNSVARLYEREAVKKAQVGNLRRSLEGDNA